ncbi:MAG TPA: hypothetical protein PLY93_11215, partial [Turneriella sp.]|nr:hypothetical protein [Turneriella sp.]
MAEALVEEKKIKDDEFDIHGDLAVSEAEDKSFVILYDSAQKTASPKTNEHPIDESQAPALDDFSINDSLSNTQQPHPEDAYIDDILSSDDIDTPLDASTSTVYESAPALEDDEPITLSSEELDGILQTDSDDAEDFHPDFPILEENKEHPGESTSVVNKASTTNTENNIDSFVNNIALDEEELPIALSEQDLDEILLEEEGSTVDGADDKSTPATDELPQGTILVEEPSDGFDEEPIALSDDELDNILADAEASHSEDSSPQSHAAPELLPHEDDTLLTLDKSDDITSIDDANTFDTPEKATVDASESRGFFDSDDDDEPITLSDDELNGILSTTEEEESPNTHTEEIALDDAPLAEPLAVEDDDEPIALSNEELDGILMDTEGTPELEQEKTSQAADQGFFEDTGENESITLSADELDGIVASATTE